MHIVTQPSPGHSTDVLFSLDAGDPNRYEDIAWFFGETRFNEAYMSVAMQEVGLSTMVGH